MKISACLIVRNEEKTLGRCLDSIRNHVDEIVVVDTGSRDRTKEIARQYAARVHDFPWRQDFAAARQFSFDRATGEWAFWLDADDVVRNAAGIRPAAETAPGEVNCFYWKYQAAQDEYGNSTCEFWRERFVRNNRSFRWSGRVHEVLVPQSRAVVCRSEDVVVIHQRLAREAANPRRNLEILQMEYAGTRGKPSPRLLHCLGCEYADLGQNDLAIATLRQYVSVSQWRDEKYLALMRIAELQRLRARFGDAAAAAREAIDTIPEWPNAYFSLAETAYFQKDWPQVVASAEAGLQRPLPNTVCITNPHALRYAWIVHYTNALYHVGRVDDALDWTRRALDICPGERWHLVNFHFFSECRRAASGIMPPASEEKPLVFWHGPIFDPSGYAEEGRDFLIGMDAAGMRVRAVPVYDWCLIRADLPAAESAALNRIARTEMHAGAHVVSVFHMTPPHYKRIDGAVWHIGRTMCESDRIPADWVEPCNAMDEIWVPCEHNIETFARSGVHREKLVRMPQGINLQRFDPGVAPLALPGRRGFNFLSVFEWSRRKGWDVLVRAFAAEFRSAENVALILKTGAAGEKRIESLRQDIAFELRNAGLGGTVPPNIVIFPSNLPAAEMPALYRAAEAFVLPSRGEGWCRPLMEAMLMGIPAIGTRWSGPLEFMNDENSWLVDCAVVDVPEIGWREAGIFRGHRWAEPSIDHLRRTMRRIVEERESAVRKAEAAREHIATKFSRERVAGLVKARLSEIMDARSRVVLLT